MPKLGVWELVIILVIVIVIFGVGRLPEIGGAIGRSIREFKKSASGSGGEDTSKSAKTTTQEEKDISKPSKN